MQLFQTNLAANHASTIHATNDNISTRSVDDMEETPTRECSEDSMGLPSINNLQEPVERVKWENISF